LSAALLSAAVVDSTGVALAEVVAAKATMAAAPTANPASNNRMSFSSGPAQCSGRFTAPAI
jgi:hypothetical protein